MNTPTPDIVMFLRIEPEPPRVTHQQKKFGGVMKDGKTPIFYEEERLKAARARFMALLKPYAPKVPFSNAVYMETKWIFKGSKYGWFIKRPDCDNLQKLLQDCMTDCGYFSDDSIVMPCIQKLMAPENAQHGVFIKLHDLSQND